MSAADRDPLKPEAGGLFSAQYLFCHAFGVALRAYSARRVASGLWRRTSRLATTPTTATNTAVTPIPAIVRPTAGCSELLPVNARRALRDTGRQPAGAGPASSACSDIGTCIYRHVSSSFHFVAPASIADELFGQALVIALPEEAFYRGYLMTALDDLWGTPWTIARAKVGWGWVVSSALFAAGHALTITNVERLAVFFPALLFGWLRARTRGVGAPAMFHVLCNVLASTLERGYGI